MYPIYALILSQCSLAKVEVDAVGRIDVVMTAMPLVVSFCLCT
jgi:hypothetical protein